MENEIGMLNVNDDDEEGDTLPKLPKNKKVI